MRIKKSISLLIILLLLASLLTACTQQTSTLSQNKQFRYINETNINPDNAISTIQELSSEKYKGRMTGTEENNQAADYIADHFKKIGIESPKTLENYKQYFTQKTILLKSEPTLQSFDKAGNPKKSYKYVKDFAFTFVSSDTEAIQIKAPLAIVRDTYDLKHNSEQFKGKVLLLTSGVRGYKTAAELAELAYSCGALGIIGNYESITIPGTLQPYTGEKVHIPYIRMEEDAFYEIYDLAKEEGSISIQCTYETNENNKTANVVGVIPGSDPKLKDEYIIIGAHYDHVGDNKNGTYNPGALDNASGTAALMEIARLIKEGKTAPKKSILFIAFSGEEMGLRGSNYYAQHPVYPMDKAVMVNMDMVGASAKIPLSIQSGEGQKADLRNTFLDYAKELGIEAEKGMTGRSDHQSFADEGVPAVCLIHMDLGNGYHTPNDNMADVSGERIKEVIRLVLYYIDQKAY